MQSDIVDFQRQGCRVDPMLFLLLNLSG